MGLHLERLLDQMAEKLRSEEVSPTEVRKSDVRQAAYEAKEYAFSKGYVDGALWMEDGTALLALAYCNRVGQNWTLWTMELSAEDREREDPGP
jgi:hypothetical protein